MGIAISGIASGIDSDSIISQLLALESQRIVAVQRRVAATEQRKSAFESLIGQLESLRNAARRFNDSSLFGTVSATSSDSGVVTASATSSATPGTYRVEVRQLATAHRLAAQGFVDDSATAVAAADGAFSFRVGDGELVELSVDDGTTLRDLANAINDKDAGVRASIVNDGSGQDAYRLILTASETGSDSRITVVDNDTTLDFDGTAIEAALADDGNSADYLGSVTSGGAYTGTENTSYIVEIITEGAADGTAKYRVSTDGGLTFDDNGGAGYDATSGAAIELANGVTIEFEDNGTLREGDTFTIDVFAPELQAPQDAVVNVDGINIRKSSNAITGLFPGVSFNLQSARPGQAVSITVRQETGDVQAALSGFLGAYNGVVGFLNAQLSYDPESNQAVPPLNGDSAARQVDRVLKSFLTGRMPGLGGDTLSSLGELGFESNEKTGLLSFNSTKLDQALRDDPTQVQRILTAFGERIDGDFTFVRRTNDSKAGTYAVNITQARTRALVTGGAAAEVLAADEQVTVSYNRRFNVDENAFSSVDVQLTAGDTAAEQVSKFNQAFSDEGLAITAFLDAAGKLSFRTDEYGADFALRVQSDTAAGAGTTRIGNAQLEAQGTDLEGTIGGAPARVLDGNHLKGADGYDSEGVELLIPDDTEGALGHVRIVDGLAQTLSKLIDGFSGPGGVLRSRADGLSTRIDSLDEEIARQERRTSAVEDRLRRQFTSLEVTLGRMQALGDYVTQQLAALPTVSSRNK